MSRRSYPCTFLKACYVWYLVGVQKYSMTHAAIVVGLNVGTVSHIMRRRRYPEAFPIPPL
jgi:hypothetical protein